MSTAVWPSISRDLLKKEEDESLARELSWLLDSLQETLESLKSGLDDCYALLAPIEPGNTLVMSTPRSESIKGHVTRVGSRIVKGQLVLRLKTYSPLQFSISETQPLILPELTQLRTLLNQSLDCIDITRWTGDHTCADFIDGQLRLLHGLIIEALGVLKGPELLVPPERPSSAARETAPIPLPSSYHFQAWNDNPPNPQTFEPPLPGDLGLDFHLSESSLVLTARVLESAQREQNLGERFAFAIGAQRRLEHDEMDGVFLFRGEEVRVKEKVRVIGGADPSLLSLGAKLGALEMIVKGSRVALGVVTGKELEDE